MPSSLDTAITFHRFNTLTGYMHVIERQLESGIDGAVAPAPRRARRGKNNPYRTIKRAFWPVHNLLILDYPNIFGDTDTFNAFIS